MPKNNDKTGYVLHDENKENRVAEALVATLAPHSVLFQAISYANTGSSIFDFVRNIGKKEAEIVANKLQIDTTRAENLIAKILIHRLQSGEYPTGDLLQAKVMDNHSTTQCQWLVNKVKASQTLSDSQALTDFLLKRGIKLLPPVELALALADAIYDEYEQANTTKADSEDVRDTHIGLRS